MMSEKGDISSHRKGMSAAIAGLCLSSRTTAETVSLELLRAIDQTVESLASARKALDGLIDVAVYLVGEVTSSKLGSPLFEDDPDIEQRVCTGLESAEEALKASVSTLKSKRASAKSDPALREHHEEAVVDAYNETIGVCSRLHDIIVDLRWAILEQIADHDTVIGEPVSSAEELIARLSA